jgi:hypothetical protein
MAPHFGRLAAPTTGLPLALSPMQAARLPVNLALWLGEDRVWFAQSPFYWLGESEAQTVFNFACDNLIRMATLFGWRLSAT